MTSVVIPPAYPHTYFVTAFPWKYSSWVEDAGSPSGYKEVQAPESEWCWEIRNHRTLTGLKQCKNAWYPHSRAYIVLDGKAYGLERDEIREFTHSRIERYVRRREGIER